MALTTTSRSRRARALSPVTKLGLKANLEVIEISSESDRAPKRTEWDTSSESETEVEPPQKSPRKETTAISSSKSSTLLAELRGLQDTAEYRSASGSTLTTPRAQRSSKRKRYADSAIGDDTSEDELQKTCDGSSSSITRSAKKRARPNKSPGRTPRPPQGEPPATPQTRTRRTRGSIAITTPKNARQSQTLSSPETVMGYTPTGDVSFSSHPQLAIELNKCITIDEPRPYCADIARRDSIIRRTFVSLSLAEPDDDTEDDNDEGDELTAPDVVSNTTAMHDLTLKACGYLAASSQGDTLQELLMSLAQVQVPAAIDAMLAPFRVVGRVTSKAKLSMRSSSSPQEDDILVTIKKRLLQNLLLVTPLGARQWLQNMCMGRSGRKSNEDGVKLLQFLLDCDAVVRMLLLQ